jgi:hypothetical protein
VGRILKTVKARDRPGVVWKLQVEWTDRKTPSYIFISDILAESVPPQLAVWAAKAKTADPLGATWWESAIAERWP